MYSEKLLSEVNKNHPHDKKIVLNLLEGWVERFKERLGLKFRRVHGEAMIADLESIELQRLRTGSL